MGGSREGVRRKIGCINVDIWVSTQNSPFGYTAKDFIKSLLKPSIHIMISIVT